MTVWQYLSGLNSFLQFAAGVGLFLIIVTIIGCVLEAFKLVVERNKPSEPKE